MRELRGKLIGIAARKSVFQEKIQAVFNKVSRKYEQLHRQYDKETNHSKNKEEQLKWN